MVYSHKYRYAYAYWKFRWRKKYRQPNNLNKVIELIERYDMEDEVGYLLEVDLVNIISYKIQYLVSFLLLLLYSSIFDNKNLFKSV